MIEYRVMPDYMSTGIQKKGNSGRWLYIDPEVEGFSTEILTLLQIAQKAFDSTILRDDYEFPWTSAIQKEEYELLCKLICSMIQNSKPFVECTTEFYWED